MPDIVIDGKRTSSRVYICQVCASRLRIEQTLPEGVGLGGGHVNAALAAAARVLGWESDRCPVHLDDVVA